MVSELIELATPLAALLAKLLDGSATPAEVQHVRDILHGKSASQQAAEDIETARRLEGLADLDDPDEITKPGGA